MTEDLIKDLYRGRINPSGKRLPDSPEYRTISSLYRKQEEKMEKMMPETCYKEFLILEDLNNAKEGIVLEGYFVYGFKLGMSMLAQVLGVDISGP